MESKVADLSFTTVRGHQKEGQTNRKVAEGKYVFIKVSHHMVRPATWQAKERGIQILTPLGQSRGPKVSLC